MTLEVSTIQLVQLKLSLRMTPWVHFFCKLLGTLFLKALWVHFLYLEAIWIPGGTLFQRIFLVVRGRLEISARKKCTSRYPDCLQVQKVYPACFQKKCTQRFAEKSAPRVSPYTTASIFYTRHKKREKERHTVAFSRSAYFFLGSSNFINKIVTTYRFVTKLLYDFNEYPYSVHCMKKLDKSNR